LIKVFFARLKIYLDRGKGHWGTIQFIPTVLILLKVYEDTTVGRFIFFYAWFTIPVIILAFYILLILIGRFEYKVGLIDKEFSINNSHNPEIKEILESLRKNNN